jgi:hypothetical protein
LAHWIRPQSQHRNIPSVFGAATLGAARGDCSFVSYQHRQATASGRDAWCDANPITTAMHSLAVTTTQKGDLIRVLALTILAIAALLAAPPARAQT